MPTYEYSCKACGHEFERFESMKATPNNLCPQCKKKKAERRISAGGGFLFKGSGFYVTDYKKSSSSTASKPAESCPNADASSKKCKSCPAAGKKSA